MAGGGGFLGSLTPRFPSASFFGVRVPYSLEEIESAIAAAPERVEDTESPYDPNDPAAVEAFWKNATVLPPDEWAGQILRRRR